MLAVLAQADTPMLAHFSRRCCRPWPGAGADLGNATPELAEMANSELEPAFWAQLAEQGFGYAIAPITDHCCRAPSLRGLLYRLLVTDFVNAVGLLRRRSRSRLSLLIARALRTPACLPASGAAT